MKPEKNNVSNTAFNESTQSFEIIIIDLKKQLARLFGFFFKFILGYTVPL